jgi:MoxR-like ATPase
MALSTTSAPAVAPALPGLAADRVAALLTWAVAERGSVHLIGPHGIGKTAYVRAWCREQGLRVVERSLPVCTPRDFCVPLPVADPVTGQRHVETLLLDQLTQAHAGDRYVLLLDEFSRADRATLNTAMELLQERTLAGQPLPGLAAVVALDNPAEDADYAGVLGLDLAQADRVATLQVDVDDIPWRSHLSTVHGGDLDEVWRVWGRLPAAARKVLCPRVLDHLVTVVDRGLAAELALPVLPSGRQRLLDDTGEEPLDVTAAALGELAAVIVATRDGGVVAGRRAGGRVGARTGVRAGVAGEGGVVGRAVAHAIAEGWRLRLVGPPGIGKTSHIRAAVEAAGYELEYLSLSQASVHDLVVPVPVAGRLDFLPAARLVRPGRDYVLVLDEFSRAPAETAAAAMELVNEKAIAGRPLEGCVAVIALDNPAEVGGLHLDTGRIDTAQASRFTATIEVGEDDLPWREVLRARFPATASAFLDWRAEDLDDAARVLVSPRCLERMLSLHAGGLDPELGLPVLGGERVPVAVAALRRRLQGVRTVGLAALVADLDGHLDRLRDGDVHAELAVLTALQRADVASLRAATAAVARLLAVLHPNHRLALVRTGGERRAVFLQALSTIPTEEVA